MFGKGQGIECVAEKLLASQEGLFSMTLFIINYSDFDSYNGWNLQRSYSIYHF